MDTEITQEDGSVLNVKNVTWASSNDFIQNFEPEKVERINYKVGKYTIPAVRITDGKHVAIIAVNGNDSAFPGLLSLVVDGHQRFKIEEIEAAADSEEESEEKTEKSKD